MEKLIQEDYLNDPWKMLVCCILLNQTTNQQVRKVLQAVFELIPNPRAASICNPILLAEVIKSTGFSKVKSERIIRMSQKWESGFSEVTDLPGVGRYASDSWKIFIQKNLSIQVTDKKLQAYLDSVLAFPDRVS
jgi:methyl-CpG-binding domain protein 4